MLLEVLPSIDISNGYAVKRIRGRRGSGLIIGKAIDVAKDIYNQGYEKVHIVDLDAAESIGNNESTVKEITKIGFKMMQVGGGIRSLEKANRLLSYGVTYVVLSTLVFIDTISARNIVDCIGHEKTIFSIDYDSEGKVLIKGWNEKGKSVYDAINIVNEINPFGVVFTYVGNEGLMTGIDENVKKYATEVNVRTKEYSGGVRDVNDLLKLKEYGFNYAIVGMSFYTGSLRGVRFVR